MRTLSGLLGLVFTVAGFAALAAGPFLDATAAHRSAGWERTAQSTMSRIGEAGKAFKANGNWDQWPADLFALHGLPEPGRDGLMEVDGTLFRMDAGTVHAWPVAYGSTGMAAWAMDPPDFGLRGTRNVVKRYSGRVLAPAMDAADPWPDRPGFGRDGQRWAAMNGR